MKIEEIEPEALKLPIDDRLALAASLLESVEGGRKAPLSMSDEEALALSDERHRELESGAVTPISHEEMMKFLRK